MREISVTSCMKAMPDVLLAALLMRFEKRNKKKCVFIYPNWRMDWQ